MAVAAFYLLLTLLIKTLLPSAVDSNCITPKDCDSSLVVEYEVAVYCINSTTIHVTYNAVSSNTGSVAQLTMQYTCVFDNDTEYTKAFVTESEELENTHILMSSVFSESKYCIVTGCTKQQRKQCWRFIDNRLKNSSNVTCKPSVNPSSTTDILPASPSGTPLSFISSMPLSRKPCNSCSSSELQFHTSNNEPTSSLTIEKLMPSTLLVQQPLSTSPCPSKSTNAVSPSLDIMATTTQGIVQSMQVAASITNEESEDVHVSTNNPIIISFSISIVILVLISGASMVALVVLSICLRRLYKRVNSTTVPIGISNVLLRNEAYLGNSTESNNIQLQDSSVIDL